MKKKFAENEVLNRVVGAYYQSNSIDLTKLADSLDVAVFIKNEGITKSCYNSQTDQFEIRVNSNEPIAKQRISIAHELARILLHQDKPEDLDTGICVPMQPQSEAGGSAISVVTPASPVPAFEPTTSEEQIKIERSASSLANKILMPKEVVEHYLEDFKISKSTSIDADTIKKLAEHFKVSDVFVISRLKEFGYYVPFSQL